MAKQHGNSGHGPEELDRAERNQAFGGDVANIDDRDEGNYRVAGPVHSASGSSDESYDAGVAAGEEPLLAEGEKVGPWDESEAQLGSREPTGSDDEVGMNASGNADDSPGGGLRSESEKPSDPSSRWGSNR